tara:strand:+ start:72 stop:317 length:246 start_codon:yes stop_codon:yes gene_type:complete
VFTVTSLCNGYSAASLGVRPDILSGTINALFSEISKQDLIPTDHFLQQNWRLGPRLQAGGNNSAMAAEEEVDRPNHKKRKS